MNLRASEPAEVAVDYLKKISAGNVNLKPGEDTAVKASTSDKKRQTIREYLGMLKLDLAKAEFESSSVQIDGDYAGVLVRSLDDLDDTKLNVYAVALVREGENWKPAPVLESFENAVEAYTEGLKDRLIKIEDWMSREKVVDFEKLLSERDSEIRSKIKAGIHGEVLESDDLGAILNGFTEALIKEDPMLMLGYLGGMSETWPENWRLKTQAIDLVVGDRAKDRFPWKLLCSPSVIRQVIHQEKSQKKGILTMVCHDPSAIGQIGKHESMFVLRFEFKKNADNLWYMDLPEQFLNTKSGGLVREKRGIEDEMLFDEFVKALGDRVGYEPIGSLNDGETRLIEAFEKGDMNAFFRLVNIGAWEDDPAKRLESLGLMWRSLNKLSGFSIPVRLDELQEESFASVAYQFFSLGKADLYEPKVFFYTKKENKFELLANGIEGLKKDDKLKAETWLKNNTGRWEAEWQKSLRDGMEWVNKLPIEQKADDGVVEKFVGDWLSALKRKDIAEVLRFSAYLGDDNGMPKKALSSLFYELGNAQRVESRLVKIYRKDSWLAVGIEHKQENKLWRSFLPLAFTDKGLMVLPDVDMIEEKGRNRDFLNRTSFERLSKFTEKEDLEILKGLFKDFQKDFTDDVK